MTAYNYHANLEAIASALTRIADALEPAVATATEPEPRPLWVVVSWDMGYRLLGVYDDPLPAFHHAQELGYGEVVETRVGPFDPARR